MTLTVNKQANKNMSIELIRRITKTARFVFCTSNVRGYFIFARTVEMLHEMVSFPFWISADSTYARPLALADWGGGKGRRKTSSCLPYLSLPFTSSFLVQAATARGKWHGLREDTIGSPGPLCFLRRHRKAGFRTESLARGAPGSPASPTGICAPAASGELDANRAYGTANANTQRMLRVPSDFM